MIFLVFVWFYVESTSHQSGYEDGKDVGIKIGTNIGFINCMDELKKQGIIEIKPDGTIVAKKPPTKTTRRKSKKDDEDKK
tara:strand:- start:628 stop:867 length:240 start_codon:yes stop_codon:yes gene_type:complete